MKTTKCLLAFFQLIIFTTLGFSQVRYYWQPVTSPTASNLNAIYSGTYIAGDNGTLLTWGGTNIWTKINGFPNVNFYGISSSMVTTSARATIVGGGGYIFSTENSFTSWIQETSGTTNNLYAVASCRIATPLTIKRFAFGAGGVILKSVWISGSNWSAWAPVTSNTTNDIKAAFLNGTTGWACGNNGTLLKTTDMGETWFSLSSGTTRQLNSVWFHEDNLRGWITGNLGTLLKTTNGGINWITVNSGVSSHLKSFIPYVVVGTSGMSLQSVDSGATWEQFINVIQPDLNAVAQSPTPITVGNLGSIFIGTVYPNYNYVQNNFNNTNIYLKSTGIFNQNTTTSNQPGFEWPKGSGKFVFFSAGLTIGAKLNNTDFRMIASSYKGECMPGCITGGSPYTDYKFRYYKVSRTDNWQTSIDWRTWGLMVPYGAPYVDVNSNGTYDYTIDTPGVKGAGQTIFLCMTDAFAASHTPGEGFGGGTLPMNAEIHWTAWQYDSQAFTDVQFQKFDVINKGTASWNKTYFAIVGDPDLGDANDDLIGCDTIRKLGYCYNGDNNDPVYGAAPPAVGIMYLRSAVIKNLVPPVHLGMTCFSYFVCTSCSPPPCESDPNGEPYAAYLMIKGYKKDSTRWMDVSQTPPKKTFFNFYGEPIGTIGWTEANGRMANCGGDTTGNIYNPASGDRRLIMGSGSENLTVNVNDTQTIVISQMVARGTTHLNSITRLKALADAVSMFYNQNIYPSFAVSGTVKYIDNNQPVTSGYVKAVKLDKATGNILTLDSAGIQSNGTYVLANVPQDSVDIGVYPTSQGPPVDYVPGYYPAAISWRDAVTLYPTGSLTNIDISVYRLVNSSNSNSVNGRVFRFADGGLKDAMVYAKSGNNYVRFASSDNLGIYHLVSVPAGSLKLIVHRMGFTSDSTTVNLATTLDSVNFILNQTYVGIIKNETETPAKYSLSQNYPNPFNPVTKIKFDIPWSVSAIKPFVTLQIFDITGRLVTELVKQNMVPGSYEVSWNASSFPSGVYFYRLSAGDFVQTKKAILIK
ncbi:MAG: YCF48-related protein [Ignavibacteriae bacterium]|nr:YCF48-related protein [Ignavibacteriota bacterium]